MGGNRLTSEVLQCRRSLLERQRPRGPHPQASGLHGQQMELVCEVRRAWDGVRPPGIECEANGRAERSHNR